MADIALLVVEEFERTSKRMKQPAGRGRGRGRGSVSVAAAAAAAALSARQEMPAGGRAAPTSKTDEWGPWLAAEAAVQKEPAAAAAAAALPGVSAFDGFFSA